MFGAFQFGQPFFGQSSQPVPTSTCELDATLDSLTCEATATRVSAGGGSGRQFAGFELPRRQPWRPTSLAFAEIELGELELDARASAAPPEETKLGALQCQSCGISWAEEQEILDLLLSGLLDETLPQGTLTIMIK
jgi:hypothetical protein